MTPPRDFTYRQQRQNVSSKVIYKTLYRHYGSWSLGAPEVYMIRVFSAELVISTRGQSLCER